AWCAAADDSGQFALDPFIAEIGQTLSLTSNDRAAEIVVERQSPEELRRIFQVFRGELNACAPKSFRDCSRAVSEDRHVGSHGFEQRRAETFVLAEGDIHGRVTVVDGEVFVGYGSGEYEALVQHSILSHQRANSREIARHRIVLANEDEAIVGIDIT